MQIGTFFVLPGIAINATKA